MVELEEWYFGSIESALAINKCKKDGDFLLHYSDIKQQYIITSRWNGQCSHFTVEVSFKTTKKVVRKILICTDFDCIFYNKQKNDSGRYGIIGSRHSFKKVQQLVGFYLSTREILSDGEQNRLLQAVNKRDKWNVKYTEIEVQMKIGTSTFGDMYVGSYAQRKVSIKTYAADKARSVNQFLLEVEVLKEFSHPNVAR